MKKILLLIFAFVLCSQTIKAQVVLDANGVTINWMGTTVPSPYFVQASPRGTLEWFAVVSNATKGNITNYAKNNPSGITFFTRPGSSTPIPFNNIVTSLVTDMSSMFSGATSFNQNISSWNVSNVTIMTSMFSGATSFNQNISSWNVTNVINMSSMFSSASSFNQNIISWNVSNITNMTSMFSGASSFNQNISSWNVSNVTSMNSMFSGATSFNQNISSWNVGNVTSMNSMFTGTALYPANYDSLLIGWSTITSAETPLKQGVSFDAGSSKYCNGASARASIISTYGWSITDGGLDCTTSSVILGTNGVTIKWIGTTVPSPYFVQASPRGTLEWFAIVSDATKSNIRDYALNPTGVTYFTRPGSSTPIPFNNIVTSLVTDMSNMFTYATSFNQNIDSWDVSNVTSMNNIFFGAHSFNQNISSWNVGKVTDMSRMFYDAYTFNQPIGNWNTSNVTNMLEMFRGANSFNKNIGNWNVSNVDEMTSMFEFASTFNQPIGSWNVSKVTKMNGMFSRDSSFNQNIGSWDVGNVIRMDSMFTSAISFNQNIGSWNVGNVIRMDSMFTDAGVNGSNYDSLLIGWSTITSSEDSLKQGVIFSGGNSKYCNGASARATIISSYGWTIKDGGTDCLILDTNGVTIKWASTTVPSPYFIQASPRGTLEWFAIVSDATKGKITNYAKNNPTGITYFTPPGSSTPIPFNNIVTSLVTDMSSMFENATAFNQPIGSWDVSNVINMGNMFSQSSSYNQPIKTWNVSKVNDMRNMFSQDTLFNQDISSWNVGKVTDMSGMFFQAKSFDQPVGNWDVSKVTDMSYMFYQATSFNQLIGDWNVGKVTNMTSMFTGAGLYTANYDSLLTGWSTITSSEDSLKQGIVFDAGSSKYCNGASARDSIISKYGWTINDGGLDCSSFSLILDTNGVTIKWTGSTVPSPYFVQAIPRGKLEWFAIISNASISNVNNYANNMASGITYFTPPGSSTPIPFNNIVTSLMTTTTSMFFSSPSFNQPIGSWDVSKVTDMFSMFYGASQFNQPIDYWNVSKVTDMHEMFWQAPAFNQNIGKWDVGNVSNMSVMFLNAGLSTANYDSLLIGWSTITTSETPLKQGISFDAGSSKYCDGASARDSIISKYGWTIIDGGLDCSILGVEELESSKLKIYPNPTNNIINIEGLTKNENNTIQIFDVQGKLVITKTINEKGAIDLSELNKGVYVIKIGEVAQRIVKM